MSQARKKKAFVKSLTDREGSDATRQLTAVEKGSLLYG